MLTDSMPSQMSKWSHIYNKLFIKISVQSKEIKHRCEHTISWDTHHCHKWLAFQLNKFGHG